MPTTVIQPDFGKDSVDTARDIVRNNAPLDHINFVLHTSETWLPLVLSEAGFFKSNGEVKRNRSDLWRDVNHGETIKLSWARILVCKHANCLGSAT